MKYLISVLILLSSCALALADSQHTTVTSVPFDFVVGNQTLPAGTYTISQVSGNGVHVLSVRREDGTTAAYIHPVAAGSVTGMTSPRLIFQHTGNEYVLTSIVSADLDFTFARRHAPAMMPSDMAIDVASQR